jgi:ubiquinone/menaquinone biosynthesis C-methylase UbiE
MNNARQSGSSIRDDWRIGIAGAVGAAITGGLAILVMSLTDLHLFPLGLIVFLAAIVVGILLGQAMVGQAQPRRRGSYGIDAPYAAAFMVFLVCMELTLAILSGKPLPFVAFFFVLAITASYFYGTLRGKFVIWSELFDNLRLRGDERILDMGCGRGAVLLLAAGHLTTGRAIGVDLWRRVDQSGNSVEAARRNAALEGVAERVELHTADMTALPFEDNSFDVVVSSGAIHNISGSAGRKKAIDEAVRVLRPGGRVVIADVRATRQYQACLTQLGMSEVTRHRLGWRFWQCGPMAAACVVTATKPEVAA